MSDDLSRVVDDAFPACPRCGARLVDAGPNPEYARLHCPACGLDVISGG